MNLNVLYRQANISLNLIYTKYKRDLLMQTLQLPKPASISMIKVKCGIKPDLQMHVLKHQT